ncbi:MAG: CHAT domain-containing protein [Lewinellaceae bacterium]|nr:CHAT domain-containing protein [Lewinellaceae bacterium]MCB9290999.1 CHAT domain-containing protein [Lewinellaceae bacterium]
MEYLNFELRIGAQNDGKYPVTVVHSPVGEASAFVTLPVDDPEFKSRLEGLEKARKYEKTRKNSPVSGPLPLEKDVSRDLLLSSFGGESSTVKTLGGHLFEKLFTAEIRSCFRGSLQKARAEKKGLRIRLRIESPGLAALPWEYLYDETEGDYFSLSSETPLVRFLELARPMEPLTIEPPLKILGMVASPKTLPPLDVEREKAQMMASVEHLIDKGLINITWLEEQTWRGLQGAIRQGSWHIFHFIGHGGFNAGAGEGAIALADEEGGVYELAATSLGRLLSGHHSMRLVILNSCEGARSSGTDLFSSTGANLIRRGIPAVVSMQFEITDRAALEFSRTFYETIAEGIPVDTAVQEARKAISLVREESSEWGTPVLYMRSSNGRLFDIDVAGAIFSNHPSTPTPLPEKKFTPTPVLETRQPGDEDSQGMNILMRKVRQFWVQGVLEQAVQHSELIKLGLDNMPEMVDSPWGSMPISSGHSIGQVFDDVGRSMLILGEPGAGKTITLLSLARELLSQYETTAGLSLPVVFNLSSWTNSRKDFEPWLADELSMKYMIPRKIGEGWLQSHRLLLLLDGLDEVGAERRNDCVDAINQFLQESAIMGVVACCRFREYIELNAKLTLNGAIRLRLLSRDKIMDYLHKAGAAYEGLTQLLKTDPSFLQLAETPFMLSMMMRAYQNLEVGQLAGGEFSSINERKKHLLDAYVKRQFRLAGTKFSL